MSVADSVHADDAAASSSRLNRAAAQFPLVLKLAQRELRSGLSGFWVFIACIALGVAVITGVGALADALLDGFAKQGRTLLGGDAAYTRVHQRASDDERSRMAALGAVSETAMMRSMARVPGSDVQSLVELKGVDGAYPLVGRAVLASGRDIQSVLAEPRTVVVPQSALDRLSVSVGDTITVGGYELTIVDRLDNEPDKISARLPFGPRVLVSMDTLLATGLVGPGTLINWRYAVTFNDAALTGGDGAAERRADVAAAFTKAGYIVRDRTNPSPQVRRVLDRLRQFLVLLGLTALMVGGVGVANAVSTFIEKRRKVVATYKSVGGTNGLVFAVMLTQVLAIAAVGVVIGVALGLLIPALVATVYGDMLPVEISPLAGLGSVWVGVGYGFPVALVFTAWPLGQTERIRPASLFRDEVGSGFQRPGWRALTVSVTAALALVGFAVWASQAPALALGFLGGVSVILVLFWLLGTGVTWLARRVPRPRRPEVALAITGLSAPGGLTRSVVLSLGAGLSLLVAVALVDRSLVEELSGRLPENSPDYFALDIQRGDLEAFKASVIKAAPDAAIETAPMLRGRIVALKGIPADRFNALPEARWVLRGDRGLSFAETLPNGSRLVEGKWWPADYSGPPLVSFTADLARELGLKIGDTVTVNVLGRDVTAEIANLRDIAWENLNINFIMVFSPNTLAAAPYNVLATVNVPDTAAPGADIAVGREVGRALPAVTLVRVRDAIESFAGLFGNIMAAIRAAGALTLVAGAFVLAGALATAQRRRILQAVVLKCIGATRRKLLLSDLVEYGFLAAISAALAIVIGSVSAWIVCVYVLEVPFVLSAVALLSAVIVALGLILTFGLIGTWRVLAARPVPYLRAL
jgi:putative ABC transport system permease protein